MESDRKLQVLVLTHHLIVQMIPFERMMLSAQQTGQAQ
jgi:hypothetical protein